MMGNAAQENPIGALPEKATRSGGRTRSRVRRNRIGPLLIVSEKTSRLGGALRVAEAVARRHGVNAHVVSFSRPLSSPSSYLLSRAADLERQELEACRRQAEHGRLRRQVHEAVGLSSFFSTAVETGELVSTAADTARVRKVEYILVALPEPGEPARAEMEGAALRLAEAADLPVLAVSADADLLPRSALVNIDPGEASMRAARATLPLVADGGSLTLVHVVPETELGPAQAQDWMSLGTRVLDKVLHRLHDTLRLAGNLEVRTMVLQGDPAEVLLELGRDFDLTAVGSPKRRSFGRLRMGSVSAGVLGGAGGSVLIVPAPRGRD